MRRRSYSSKPPRMILRVIPETRMRRATSFKNLVSDKPQPKGWSIQPTTDKSLVVRRGVLVPEKPFGFAAGTMLTVHLKHNMPHSQIAIGRFRISVTAMADPLE